MARNTLESRNRSAVEEDPNGVEHEDTAGVKRNYVREALRGLSQAIDVNKKLVSELSTDLSSVLDSSMLKSGIPCKEDNERCPVELAEEILVFARTISEANNLLTSLTDALHV